VSAVHSAASWLRAALVAALVSLLASPIVAPLLILALSCDGLETVVDRAGRGVKASRSSRAGRDLAHSEDANADSDANSDSDTDGDDSKRLVRVKNSAAMVYASVSDSRLTIGQVKYGAVLEVRDCVVSARCANDWVRLRPTGYVKRAALEDVGPGEVEPGGGDDGALVWGTARQDGTKLYASPSVDAGVVREVRSGLTLAFTRNDELRETGWLAHVQRGFVPVRDVKLARPSALVGVHSPKLPLAFTWKKTRFLSDGESVSRPRGEKASAKLALKESASSREVAKFERFEAVRILGDLVETNEGVLPRGAVRVVQVHPRPPGVPRTAQWLHIDVREQVLTAYEGDELVFATLVSTGAAKPADRATRPGLFRVWHKSLHDRMQGEDYHVEEVPFIQYFHRGQGLHGAFWHDSFGQRLSHGCINLSMADAESLFHWAEPPLPPGWHSVNTEAMNQGLLYVFVAESTQDARKLN
jgi:hypothetical protein